MKMFFLIIMGAYLAGNIYIFVRLMQLISNFALGWKIVISSLFWALALLLMISMFLRDIPLPTAITKAMFNLGSIWMVFTLYMVLLLLVFDIAKIFIPSMQWGSLYAFGLTALVLSYGYYNYRHPKIEHIDITLDKYFDEAILVGYHTVRLIHGKGTGALKNALWKFLRGDRRISSFRIGQYGEGDGGVTVVELK